MLHPYPDQFPSEGLQMLIDALRGQPVDAKEASHAAWHLVGYGLSKWDVHGPGAFSGPPLTNAELANLLELEKAGEVVKTSLPNLPWDKIIPLLLALLQMFLDKKS